MLGDDTVDPVAGTVSATTPGPKGSAVSGSVMTSLPAAIASAIALPIALPQQRMGEVDEEIDAGEEIGNRHRPEAQQLPVRRHALAVEEQGVGAEDRAPLGLWRELGAQRRERREFLEAGTRVAAAPVARRRRRREEGLVADVRPVIRGEAPARIRMLPEPGGDARAVGWPKPGRAAARRRRPARRRGRGNGRRQTPRSRRDAGNSRG